MRKYWLLKSEADSYSIDDLKRDKTVPWTGIRNYRARNFMRDEMKVGDGVLFYHSSSDPIGIVGSAKVSSQPHPDVTAQDKQDDHYDPKATKENPIWMCVDIEFVSKFSKPILLEEMRMHSDLKNMEVLRKGNRLSITPVTEKEFDSILKIAKQDKTN